MGPTSNIYLSTAQENTDYLRSLIFLASINNTAMSKYQEHILRQYPAYGKRCDKCSKLNHFKEECRGARSSAVNTIEKETVHEQEPGIKTVNINSINFNSNHSTIIANLKTSSSKATTVVSYKVDTSSDGNIILCNAGCGICQLSRR